MEEDSEFRQWDDLIPDALGLIFRHLPLQEILTVIPRVCKSWGRAVTGPYCWQEIDIEQWSRHRRPEILHRMLEMLITRSAGALRKLCVSGLPNDQALPLIADHYIVFLLSILVASAKSLQTLRLPRSEVNDPIMEQIAARLSTLTFLDVSYCRNIGAPALEAIVAIADTMPKLKHLEIAYLLIYTEAVLKIIMSCPDLQLLDVRGCWNVKLDVKRFLLCGLKVIGPLEDGYYDINGWDDCSNYSGSSGYLAWDFLAGEIDDDYDFELDYEMSDGIWGDEQSMEDVEMTFYDGFDFDHAGWFDWPPSP
ncbi:F-box protein FBW2 isoform X3 [Ziziphus jujuba]|uniref:F-box protein FBW2 isoform X3 n=1 Tax=Ziziphus jujuba TaxID=326968 RepID=A0ABM3ITV4_ZIZJJ|nr:F-box protein FBW2 isoform X3 [Ziziphus jujuba]